MLHSTSQLCLYQGIYGISLNSDTKGMFPLSLLFHIQFDVSIKVSRAWDLKLDTKQLYQGSPTNLIVRFEFLLFILRDQSCGFACQAATRYSHEHQQTAKASSSLRHPSLLLKSLQSPMRVASNHAWWPIFWLLLPGNSKPSWMACGGSVGRIAGCVHQDLGMSSSEDCFSDSSIFFPSAVCPSLPAWRPI